MEWDLNEDHQGMHAVVILFCKPFMRMCTKDMTASSDHITPKAWSTQVMETLCETTPWRGTASCLEPAFKEYTEKQPVPLVTLHKLAAW